MFACMQYCNNRFQHIIDFVWREILIKDSLILTTIWLFCRCSESGCRQLDMWGVWEDQGEWEVCQGCTGGHKVGAYTCQR